MGACDPPPPQKIAHPTPLPSGPSQQLVFFWGGGCVITEELPPPSPPPPPVAAGADQVPAAVCVFCGTKVVNVVLKAPDVVHGWCKCGSVDWVVLCGGG